MFRKFEIAFRYVGMKVSIAFLKLILSFNKVTVGGVNFYGTNKNILRKFEEAIRTELPKYDGELSNLVLAKKIKLDFFNYNNVYLYRPEVGIFFIPKWMFDHSAEGVCQHIVFCIIGSKYTGIGLHAATSISSRKKMHLILDETMRQWIIDKKFPERWIPSYSPSE